MVLGLGAGGSCRAALDVEHGDREVGGVGIHLASAASLSSGATCAGATSVGARDRGWMSSNMSTRPLGTSDVSIQCMSIQCMSRSLARPASSGMWWRAALLDGARGADVDEYAEHVGVISGDFEVLELGASRGSDEGVCDAPGDVGLGVGRGGAERGAEPRRFGDCASGESRSRGVCRVQR